MSCVFCAEHVKSFNIHITVAATAAAPQPATTVRSGKSKEKREEDEEIGYYLSTPIEQGERHQSCSSRLLKTETSYSDASFVVGIRSPVQMELNQQQNMQHNSSTT